MGGWHVKIQRKKVSEIVLEELKKLIKSGEIPIGASLPTEKELTEQFGVSRVPIREALSVLEASGIIVSKQGGRNVVQDINLANMYDEAHFEMVELDEVLDLLEMRTIIESEAAYLAAVRHSDEDIQRLKLSLDDFKIATEDNWKVGYEADFSFHRTMVNAAHNPFLTKTMENLADLHLRALKFSLEKNLGWAAKRKEVYEEHVEIYEAVKQRDGSRAKIAVIDHLTGARLKLNDRRILDRLK